MTDNTRFRATPRRGALGGGKRLWAALLLLATWGLSSTLRADTFEGLRPGVSTKADADRVLGPPIRVVVEGSRCDYDPEPFDARRISIEFAASSQVIRAIDLYFKKQYPADTYREWFKLRASEESTVDANGNRVESYLAQGISLHFSGPDESFPVSFFRHFDPAAGARPAEAAPKPMPRSSIPGLASSRTYFGVIISPSRGQGIWVRYVTPASPAEKAGLQDGDVILELGEVGFYKAGADPGELALLSSRSPVGVPIPLLFARGSQRWRTHLTLEERGKEEIERLQRSIADSNHAEGVEWVDKGKHRKAIPHLERAFHYSGGKDAGTMELIGLSYFHARQYSESLAAYQTALALVPGSPMAIYFIAACFDQLEDREKAVEYYSRFLVAHNGDRRMIKFAQRRLDALTGQTPERNWGKTLGEVIEAIQKEVQDPPP